VSATKANSVLTPLDIVTTAGSMGNIIAAMGKLPGAQIAGENGRLMVRGGDPSETQTLINGILVNQPNTASANGVSVCNY
jgi:outer membrane receptor for ferrienterochelin and colicin